jgi:hypothetical protein
MSRTYLPYLLYLALAVAGAVLLRGDLRLVFLVFIGGLALKTWIGHLRRYQEIDDSREGTTAVDDDQ